MFILYIDSKHIVIALFDGKEHYFPSDVKSIKWKKDKKTRYINVYDMNDSKHKVSVKSTNISESYPKCEIKTEIPSDEFMILIKKQIKMSEQKLEDDLKREFKNLSVYLGDEPVTTTKITTYIVIFSVIVLVLTLILKK